MPRPRKKTRSDLPANLYEPRPGYYAWRDPITRKTFALGKISRNSARDQAIEANRLVERHEAESLVERLHAAEKGETFGYWLEEYQTRLERKNLASSTMRQHRWRIKAMTESFGHEPIKELLDTRLWSDWLESFIEAGKHRSATAWRSWLKGCWDDAICRGRVKTNPINPIRMASAKVKRDRLTIETALLILEEARASRDTWIARSIELALLTGQRREDIAVMQFRQRKTATSWVQEDGLYVIQLKTGNRVILPLDLGLTELNMTISDAISACRNKVASPWLIHQTRPYRNSAPGSNIWIDTISRRFADMRDQAAKKSNKPLWDPDKDPPTFHELRSLSIRLYSKHHSSEFAQALAGHKGARMTAEYEDSRGAEWVRVQC